MTEIGLYLHFPFCIQKCNYCDFHSFGGMKEFMPRYIEAIKKEISGYSCILSKHVIKTIFIGGGTPTVFDGEQICEVLHACRQSLCILKDAEITIEANPATLDSRKLSILRSAGVNRLSLGLQARQDRHLKTLGRLYSFADFLEAVVWARQEGFENINADVMYALPGQIMEEWIETLEGACSAKVEHMSVYGLKLEEGTPLYDMHNKGIIDIPGDDEDRAMFYSAKQCLKKYGLQQYEISNFAKPGMECRHNLIYWHNQEYIGCGSGAHSYLHKERFSNYADIAAYIDAALCKGGRVQACREIIGRDEERFETIMLGLRLVQGLNKELFAKKFGQGIHAYYGGVIEHLENQGLLSEDSQHLWLTEKGMDLQNAVLLKFMD